MKTIGLIGGMSWQSTLEYYRIINEEVHRRLGKLHSAKILLTSLDFQEIEEMMQEDNWIGAGTRMAVCAKQLDKGGVDFILICTNTLHKVADWIETSGTVPLLHIVDAVGEAVQKSGMRTVGLLGTRVTMEDPFYRERLHNKWGVEVRVPPKEERECLQKVIFEELCLGIKRDDSLSKLKGITEGLAAQGVQGIVLGCTELSLILKESDSPVPLFDSTALHAVKAVERALAE